MIRGQIVLGEQVGDHRDLGDLGELGLLRIPVLPAQGLVVLALRPRDVIVRVPVLGDTEVAVDILLDHGLQLVQQLEVGEILLHGYIPCVGGPDRNRN
ncbi:Uncharacterised protein [Mycobacteroides abscessus subsp. abscessus]|nr:Uncharacterised protein [Mycobacteroides abscessus subsp. abscessus]